jgi:hypothetical protein
LTRESHTEPVGAKLTKALNAQLREACRRLGISLNEGLIRAITAWLEKVDP